MLPMLAITGAPPSSEKPEGTYPYMVRSDDGRDVPVVQAFAFGKYLGNLKVTFDPAGNVIKAVGNPILLDSSVAQGRASQIALRPNDFRALSESFTIPQSL